MKSVSLFLMSSQFIPLLYYFKCSLVHVCTDTHTHTDIYTDCLLQSPLKYFMLLLYNKIDFYMLFIRPHDNFKIVQQKKYGAVHGDIMFFYNPTRHI